MSGLRASVGSVARLAPGFEIQKAPSVPELPHYTRVVVDLGPRAYAILTGTNLLSRTAEFLESWGLTPGRCLIVTDRNVRTPHAEAVSTHLEADGWEPTLATLEPGEETKRLEIVAGLYDRLVESRADRRTLIMAVGGGVIGDTAGFVAATYARGIPFVQIPTTLLAHVDSSVGGKVGINHPQGKNLIGAFYQPKGVLIETRTLNTLPDREYRSGLAEVIKYGMILDAKFFEYLEQHVTELNDRTPAVMEHVISRCCRLKADVVEQDELEITGLRAVLNYGHTFAHAFEALCGYGQLLHGEAVAIGMIVASRLAERCGRIDAALTERQSRLLQAVGLPIRLPSEAVIRTDDVLDRMLLDKKTVSGRLRFVLPTCMGHVELMSDIDPTHVRHVLEHLL